MEPGSRGHPTSPRLPGAVEVSMRGLGRAQVAARRSLLGLAHGAILVLSVTLVADLFPPLERGFYQGLVAAVTSPVIPRNERVTGWNAAA